MSNSISETYEKLSDFASDIMSNVNLEEFSISVNKIIYKTLCPENFELYLLNRKSGKLNLIFSNEEYFASNKDQSTTVNDLVIESFLKDKIINQNSLLNVPIKYHDKIVGVLSITIKIENTPDQDHITLLKFISNLCGLGYNRLRADELRKEAEIKRKEIESELKLSSTRISHLIQNLPSGVLLEDENRKIVLVNDEFRMIFGIPFANEQLVGMDCSTSAEQSKSLFINEEEFVNKISKILKEKKIIRNEELRMKDGRFLERDYIPIFIDSLYYGHLWIYRDITERRQYEDNLADLKQFFEQILFDLPGQIAVFDKDLKYLFVNPMSVKDPFIREWIIGKDDFDYCRYRKLDENIARQRAEKLLEAGEKKEILSFEEKFTGADGEIKYFLRVLSPVLDKKNNIDKILAYGLDITDRKKLIQDLERSNKALSEFAYIASHDLREPLRKISSFGNLLRDSIEHTLNEDDKENLQFMIDGALRMQEMIDDLLKFSRLTSEPHSIEEIDLNYLIDEILSFDLSKLIEENSAVINYKVPDKIISNKTHIRQLLQNLISNAIKYRKENEHPVISIIITKEKRKISGIIEDNGIGIDQKYHDQIFEMFKRLHNREKAGTGIGLSICKKIIEIHSGQLSVKSVPGKGSKFIFTLQEPK